jgi:hypothetical protein
MGEPRSPSEPRNPLEVVEEAFARTIVRFETCATVQGLDPKYIAIATAEARAALALVRKMRADARVGWAQWVDDEHWLFEVTDEPSMAQDPALLLPLPDSTDG